MCKQFFDSEMAKNRLCAQPLGSQAALPAPLLLSSETHIRLLC